MNVWDLIKAGQFENACKLADEEYETKHDNLVLRNKVKALFHLKNYSAAVETAKTLIENNTGESEADFISLGIAYWGLKKHTAAVEAWKKGKNSKYSDASGGIGLWAILYFASVKLKDVKLKEESEKEISKLLKYKESSNWPGPIGLYLLGKISKTELMDKTLKTVPVLRERQLCQANFAIAIKEFEIGDIDFYKKMLQNILDIGVNAYLESMYYIAKIEA